MKPWECRLEFDKRKKHIKIWYIARKEYLTLAGLQVQVVP